MFSSNCYFLTFTPIFQEASKVVWYSHILKFLQFVMIYTIFGIINKAEIYVWFFCILWLFDDPPDVDNLISGFSAFPKSSLHIWKFIVHVLLKPGLENFEHYFASMWDECKCVVVWSFFSIAFLWDWNENWLFQACGHCRVFQICWHIECSTLITLSFRIWNSSTGIPLLPLALFVVMLLKAHWLCIPGCLALGEYDHTIVVILVFKIFFYSSSVYSCHLFLRSSAFIVYTISVLLPIPLFCHLFIIYLKNLKLSLTCQL